MWRPGGGSGKAGSPVTPSSNGRPSRLIAAQSSQSASTKVTRGPGESCQPASGSGPMLSGSRGS